MVLPKCGGGMRVAKDGERPNSAESGARLTAQVGHRRDRRAQLVIEQLRVRRDVCIRGEDLSRILLFEVVMSRQALIASASSPTQAARPNTT
jgi:hypothetical protein